jgi:hypothetical protein
MKHHDNYDNTNSYIKLINFDFEIQIPQTKKLSNIFCYKTTVLKIFLDIRYKMFL